MNDLHVSTSPSVLVSPPGNRRLPRYGAVLMVLSIASFVLGAVLFVYYSLIVQRFFEGNVYILPPDEFQAVMDRMARAADLRMYIALPLAMLGGIGMNVIPFKSKITNKSQIK
jgi:hypothetical protein